MKKQARSEDTNGQREDWLEQFSHQLIAPLAGMEATADRLARNFEKWDTEHVLAELMALRGMARWAARLARNLDWEARRRSNVNILAHTRWTKVKSLLLSCIEDVRGLADSVGVKIHLQVPIGESWEIRIEPTLFGQAIVNLLENAVKYAKNNTIVHIAANMVESGIGISITDYGIPIREIEIEKIFERGYRSEAAIKKVVVGTGTGLPIAKEIIQLHSGQIVVEPSPFSTKEEAYIVTFKILLPQTICRKRE